jgi:hypothetical protein
MTPGSEAGSSAGTPNKTTWRYRERLIIRYVTSVKVNGGSLLRCYDYFDNAYHVYIILFRCWWLAARRAPDLMPPSSP